MKPKFNPGREVMTRGVSNWASPDNDGGEVYDQLLACLRRHVSGDWGDVCPEDQESNRVALINGDRLLSAYTIDGQKIWIITEADRSSTTILFPDEY